MKNLQVIDGAINSTFQIYQVSDDLFDMIFPNGTDVAFVDEVNDALGLRGRRRFWDQVYQRPIDKKEASGVHGTLHLTGSVVAKEYFPTRRESEAINNTIIRRMTKSPRNSRQREAGTKSTKWQGKPLK